MNSSIEFDTSASSNSRSSSSSSAVHAKIDICSLPTDEEGNRILPCDFSPTSMHTICARGKTYWDHKGNVKYRQLIASATKKYQQATNKLEKTLIVSEIVDALENSGRGGLVKRDPLHNNRWVVCNIHFAREKVSQSLRDSLSTQYKSSTKTKKTRRMKVTEQINCDVDRAITSNVGVMSRIHKLNQDLQLHNDEYASDLSVCTLFSQANLDILETIKQDTSLLSQFQLATTQATMISASP